MTRYAVMAEYKTQGPILLETEGDMSLDAASRRMGRLRGEPDVIRACIVSLTYAAGNSDLCPPEDPDFDEVVF